MSDSIKMMCEWISNFQNKTFNKTASLMAFSCQAVTVLAVASANAGLPDSESKTRREEDMPTWDVGYGKWDVLTSTESLVDSAFSFGKNLGVAFQLVDDWLDFTQDAELLGKPAAADLRYILLYIVCPFLAFSWDYPLLIKNVPIEVICFSLGLATAPVLFAAEEHPVLKVMTARKFSKPGDIKDAFELVLQSQGLARNVEKFDF